MTLRRSPANPILTRRDVPDVPPHIGDPSGVLHPGACLSEGEVHLLLLVQARTGETFLLPARSADGYGFRIEARIVRLEGLESIAETVHRFRDPRMTVIGGEIHLTLTMDTDAGARIGLARRKGPHRYEFLGSAGPGGVADGALFPEPVDGRYLMLSRPDRIPLSGGGASGDEITLSESGDLLAWKPVGAVMKGRPGLWDERIGSGPPPVKTREGWLHLYHGVAVLPGGAGIRQAGAVLLDLVDPTVVLARTKGNILEPREPWEMIGRAPNEVHPTGMVVEETDGDGFARSGSRVKIYYGAAGTCVGLALATVADLLRACRG